MSLLISIANSLYRIMLLLFLYAIASGEFNEQVLYAMVMFGSLVSGISNIGEK